MKRILEVGREQCKAEAVFSDLKWKFGDTLRARGREQVANIIGWIVIVFNLFKSVRWSD